MVNWCHYHVSRVLEVMLYDSEMTFFRTYKHTKFWPLVPAAAESLFKNSGGVGRIHICSNFICMSRAWYFVFQRSRVRWTLQFLDETYKTDTFRTSTLVYVQYNICRTCTVGYILNLAFNVNKTHRNNGFGTFTSRLVSFVQKTAGFIWLLDSRNTTCQARERQIKLEHMCIFPTPPAVLKTDSAAAAISGLKFVCFYVWKTSFQSHTT